MAKGFTDIAIRNLKAGDVRRELPDPGCTGLYVIVQPTRQDSPLQSGIVSTANRGSSPWPVVSRWRRLASWPVMRCSILSAVTIPPSTERLQRKKPATAKA